jgi:hypothetical protein
MIGSTNISTFPPSPPGLSLAGFSPPFGRPASGSQMLKGFQGRNPWLVLLLPGICLNSLCREIRSLRLRPLPNGRGSDRKSRIIKDAIGAPTVREGLLRRRTAVSRQKLNSGADAHGGAPWARRPAGRSLRDAQRLNPQQERDEGVPWPKGHPPGGLPHLISAGIPSLGKLCGIGLQPASP